MYDQVVQDHCTAISAIDMTLMQYDFCLRGEPQVTSSEYRDFLMRNVATLRAERRHHVEALRWMLNYDQFGKVSV